MGRYGPARRGVAVSTPGGQAADRGAERMRALEASSEDHSVPVRSSPPGPQSKGNAADGTGARGVEQHSGASRLPGADAADAPAHQRVRAALQRSRGAVVIGCPAGDEAWVIGRAVHPYERDSRLVSIGAVQGERGPLVEIYVAPRGFGASLMRIEDFLDAVRVLAGMGTVLVQIRAGLIADQDLMQLATAVASLPGVRLLVAEPVVDAAQGRRLASAVGAEVVRVGRSGPAECEAICVEHLGGECSPSLVARVWSSSAGHRRLMIAVLEDGMRDGGVRRANDGWVCSALFAAAGTAQLAVWDEVHEQLSEEAADVLDLCALTGGLRLSTLVRMADPAAVEEAISSGWLGFSGPDEHWVCLGGMLADRAVVRQLGPARTRSLALRFRTVLTESELNPQTRWRWADTAGEAVPWAVMVQAALAAIGQSRADLVLQARHGRLREDKEADAYLMALAYAQQGRLHAVRELGRPHGWFEQQPATWLNVELLRLLVDAAEGASPVVVEQALEALVAAHAAGELPMMPGYGDAEGWLRRTRGILALRHGIGAAEAVPGPTEALPADGRERARLMVARFLTGQVAAAHEGLRELIAEYSLRPPTQAVLGQASTYLGQCLLLAGDRAGAREMAANLPLRTVWAFEPELADARWVALSWMETGDVDRALPLLQRLVAQERENAPAGELRLVAAAHAAALAARGEAGRAAERIAEAQAAPPSGNWLARQYSGVLLARAQRQLGRGDLAATELLALIQAEDVRDTPTTRLFVLVEALRWGESEWWEDALACAADVDSPLATALLRLDGARRAGDPEEALAAEAALRRLGQGALVATSTRPAVPLPAPGLPDATLTVRQVEIAKKAVNGERSAVIAEGLGITTRTVESHLQQIYARIGVHSRAELRAWLQANSV